MGGASNSTDPNAESPFGIPLSAGSGSQFFSSEQGGSTLSLLATPLFSPIGGQDEPPIRSEQNTVFTVLPFQCVHMEVQPPDGHIEVPNQFKISLNATWDGSSVPQNLGHSNQSLAGDFYLSTQCSGNPTTIDFLSGKKWFSFKMSRAGSPYIIKLQAPGYLPAQIVFNVEIPPFKNPFEP